MSQAKAVRFIKGDGTVPIVVRLKDNRRYTVGANVAQQRLQQGVAHAQTTMGRCHGHAHNLGLLRCTAMPARSTDQRPRSLGDPKATIVETGRDIVQIGVERRIDRPPPFAQSMQDQPMGRRLIARSKGADPKPQIAATHRARWGGSWGQATNSSLSVSDVGRWAKRHLPAFIHRRTSWAVCQTV